MIIQKDLVNLMSCYSLNERFSGINSVYLGYLERACFSFDITVDELLSKGRKRECVWLRFMLYDYLKTNTSLVLSQIGKIFNRDHTTVLYGIGKHKEYLDWNDKEYISMYNYFKERI